jgi:hypothetical protein
VIRRQAGLASGAQFGRRTSGDGPVVTVGQRLTISMPTCGSIRSIGDLTIHFLAEVQVSLGQFDPAAAAHKRRLERNPHSETSYALLAACYGQLGRIAEARAAWAHPTCLRSSRGYRVILARCASLLRTSTRRERMKDGLGLLANEALAKAWPCKN